MDLICYLSLSLIIPRGARVTWIHRDMVTGVGETPGAGVAHLAVPACANGRARPMMSGVVGLPSPPITGRSNKKRASKVAEAAARSFMDFTYKSFPFSHRQNYIYHWVWIVVSAVTMEHFRK
jgi:hypothetical protein